MNNAIRFESKVLEEAVKAFAGLPGIGAKSALRMVLQLLRSDADSIRDFAHSVSQLADKLCYCTRCNYITEAELCSICANANRDQSLICVVETIRDLIAIENTRQFAGTYHVLGGLISPIDGISPSDLQIQSLVDRVGQEPTREVILALSTTMEGDTTNFYIHRQLSQKQIKVSTIARGIALGDEIQYADELTLGQSILNRSELKL
jgi:recombination protein RecR